MSNRILPIVASLLIAGAMAAQCYWLSCCGQAAMTIARAATDGEEKRAVAHSAAERILDNGGLVPVSGFWAAAAALVLTITARWQRKGVLTGLPIVLLVFYVMLLFVQV